MNKVLVANRGEIARRVIRTLKIMNIKSVAIYSDADKNALHVQEADESVYMGKSPASESYLLQDKIIEYCKELSVDAIHPGYGFLSENAEFARKLQKNNIKLIGPSPESMEVMGDKLSAKQAVKKFNVPLVPGIDKAVSDVKGGGDLKKLNTLKLQLDKLNAIGGVDSIVPSEGIVFKYKGNTYKFTGAFAPINQIAGLINF